MSAPRQRTAAGAALLARALGLHQRGESTSAERLYLELLAAAPDDADALHLLGVLRHRDGRVADGLALIERALAARPNEAPVHCNRGAALRDLGRHDEALAACDRALALDPRHAISAANRVAVLLDLGRPADALAASEYALALAPDTPAVRYNQGRCLQDLGRTEAALDAFEQARAGLPDFMPLLDNLCACLRALGRERDALAVAEQLVALQPDRAANRHLHASVLLTLDRPKDALASLQRALDLDPDQAASQHDLGHAWTALGRPDLALAPYARALALDPSLPFLRGQWLHTRLKVCEWDGLDAETARLVAAIDAGEPATAPFPATLLDLGEARLLRAARTFSTLRHPAVGPALPPWPKTGRIKLGYFSPDFHQHPLAVLCAGLFEQHDRARFEVIGFALGPVREDAMRERLRAGFDRFIEVPSSTDVQIAALARELRIDIAIDLAGPTQGSRGAIFAARAAPVQVAMIGMPGTGGAGFIDHLIADEHVAPNGHEAHYSEHVVRLFGSYLANDSRRAVTGPAPTRASVGLPERGFVFCSFNQNAKITPAVFGLWMELLREVEGSVLWLLQDNPLAATKLRAAAERAGIEPQRIVFAARVPIDAHLARHACADLFLDTLPYNAHTSACDALWAGLPVLTRVGDTFAGRVGASVLHAAGLHELVVHSAAEYTASALELARNPARLATLKARLVGGRDHCALFDTARYTRGLEAAFMAMLD